MHPSQNQKTWGNKYNDYPDPVFTFDVEGRLAYANAAFTELTGLKPAENEDVQLEKNMPWLCLENRIVLWAKMAEGKGITISDLSLSTTDGDIPYVMRVHLENDHAVALLIPLNTGEKDDLPFGLQNFNSLKIWALELGPDGLPLRTEGNLDWLSHEGMESEELESGLFAAYQAAALVYMAEEKLLPQSFSIHYHKRNVKITRESWPDGRTGLLFQPDEETDEVRLGHLLENLPAGLVLGFGSDQKYTYAGGPLLRSFGKPEEFLGKAFHEKWLGLEANQDFIDACKEALKGHTRVFEFQLPGLGRLLLATGPMPGKHGEQAGGILAALDLQKAETIDHNLQQKLNEGQIANERLRQEVAIRKQIEENLHAYSEELKAKNAELEQFAYVASHDLQEPLRNIFSFVQLLSRRYTGKLDQDADDFIKFIMDGASHMQRLIFDLLTYSRIGRKEDPSEEVDMNEVVQQARQNLALIFEETDARLNTQELPKLQGVQMQLVQLMQNLFSNALKFRKPDVVPEITLTCRDTGKHWEFTVSDNGIGLDMAHKDRVFQIFQRLHTRDSYPGTGIGLAICKKIVERHGGEIYLSKADEEGSEFTFTLLKKMPKQAV